MSLKDEILGVEARWVMGRVMAGDFLEAEAPFYGAGWDIGYERPEPGLFEMRSGVAFGATSSTATTRGWSRPSCARGTRTGCGRSTRR
jgi:hypothetical protein